MKKFLTTVFGICMAIGFVLIIGSAGSSDLELIDFKTLLIQSGLGLALTGIGFIGIRFIYPSDFI